MCNKLYVIIVDYLSTSYNKQLVFSINTIVIIEFPIYSFKLEYIGS